MCLLEKFKLYCFCWLMLMIKAHFLFMFHIHFKLARFSDSNSCWWVTMCKRWQSSGGLKNTCHFCARPLDINSHTDPSVYKVTRKRDYIWCMVLTNKQWCRIPSLHHLVRITVDLLCKTSIFFSLHNITNHKVIQQTPNDNCNHILDTMWPLGK